MLILHACPTAHDVLFYLNTGFVLVHPGSNRQVPLSASSLPQSKCSSTCYFKNKMIKIIMFALKPVLTTTCFLLFCSNPLFY